MTKKTKKAKKVTKVVVELPKIEPAPETYKEKPVVEVPKELPAEAPVKPVVNPNDPTKTENMEGFKDKGIMNVMPVYTLAQFKEVRKAYEKQNPGKAAAKKSELDAKERRLK